MNHINERRVFISRRAWAAVEATFASPDVRIARVVRGIIKASHGISIEEAAKMVGCDLDGRNEYRITRDGDAVLGLRENLKEDGHTLESYTVVAPGQRL